MDGRVGKGCGAGMGWVDVGDGSGESFSAAIGMEVGWADW